jgi:hypothetical protein
MSEASDRLRDLLPGLAPRIPEGEEFLAWVASVPRELLEEILRLEPGQAARVADALVSAGPDAAAVLVRAEEGAPEKPVRKSLRRAIHKLRSRGTEVPVHRTRVTGRLPPTPEEGSAREALLGPVGPRGERIVALTAPAPHGWVLLQVLASDEQGIIRIESMRGRRAAVRSAMKDLRGRQGARLVPVPPDAARELLRRLHRMGIRQEGEARAALEAELASPSEEDPPRTPGEQVRERLRARPMPEGMADVELRRRVERGAVLPYLIEGEGVEQAAAKLQGADQSPLVLSATQTTERRAGLHEEVAAALLDEETRERLAVRLEESAWLLEAGGDADGARAALVVAGQVRAAPRPDRVEFLQLVLQLSLEAAGRKVTETQKGRLIIAG